MKEKNICCDNDNKPNETDDNDENSEIIKKIPPYDSYDDVLDENISINLDPELSPQSIPQLNSVPIQHIKLISQWTDEEKSFPILNVIICVRSKASYDKIFEKYPQNIPNGRAAVYVVTSHIVGEILDIFQNIVTNVRNEVKEMFTIIKSVQPSDVVFYWECCQGCYINNTLYSLGVPSINLIHHLVRVEKIMVMCSDFALKGLIADWKEELLGECPFEIVGAISGKISLLFNPETLVNSASVQLQNVGKLSKDGHAIVNTLSETISYIASAPENPPYVMKVLTVVECMQKKNQSKAYTCNTVDNIYNGKAGHVTLEYKEGGTLLVSNCHFIELEQISTTDEQLYDVMTQEYGEEMSKTMSLNLSQLKGVAKCKEVQRQVSRLVSGSIPCKRETSQSMTNQNTLNSVNSLSSEINIEI